jgi:hypothetical protein
MLRIVLLIPTVAIFALVTPERASAEPKHPHIHHALYEMREAIVELKDARHDFAGHREKAIHALHEAIKQTEKALEGAGDPYKGFLPARTIYKEYMNHHHLRHAQVEMREALKQLREAKHDFGGHREKAIKDLEVALIQVEKCIDNIK